jgi:hypothetical protein
LTTSINNDGDKGEIGKFQNDKVMSTKGILPLGEISPKKKNTDRHGCDQRHVSILTTWCVLGFCWLGFSMVCKSDVSRGLELIDDNGDYEDQRVSVVVGGVLRSSSRCSCHLLADIMCSSSSCELINAAAAAAAASRRL